MVGVSLQGEEAVLVVRPIQHEHYYDFKFDKNVVINPFIRE